MCVYAYIQVCETNESITLTLGLANNFSNTCPQEREEREEEGIFREGMHNGRV